MQKGDSMENNELVQNKKNEIKFHFNNMRAENFKNEKYGISYKDIMKLSQKVDLAYYKVMDDENRETEAFFDLVRNPQNLSEIKEYANFVAENFENFVILGIGGSALGARALFTALTTMDYKKCDLKRNQRPNWFVRDSICPEKFACLLEAIDVKKTMFCVVTKSGGTLETLVQLNLVIEKLKEALGDEYTKNICAVTANLDGKLNKWATENNVKTFYFGNDVSGRFSVFSAVGLLPAAVVGADIDKLLEGANNMLQKCHTLKFFENPALYGATLQKIALDKGCNISYLMPYSDNLKIMAEWYCQLWAESLGKTISSFCKNKHVGQTPVKALGTVDQHSQMQLCLEGPYDKIVTFIRVNKHENDAVIPNLNNGLLDDYVCGHKLSDILNVSQQATEKALLERNRLNRTIEIDELDEYSMGELLMYFMIETAFMGALMDVNTFNQPSVELIKLNIKDILSKKARVSKIKAIVESQKEQEEQKEENAEVVEEAKPQDVIEEKNLTDELTKEPEVMTQIVSEPVEETFVSDDEIEDFDFEISKEEQEQLMMPEVEELEKVEVPEVQDEQKIDFSEDEQLEGQQQFELELEEEKSEPFNEDKKEDIE